MISTECFLSYHVAFSRHESPTIQNTASGQNVFCPGLVKELHRGGNNLFHPVTEYLFSISCFAMSMKYYAFC